jgi:hypothetical protein
VTKTVGDGVTLNITDSIVTVDVDPADTADLLGDHQLQCEVSLASGVVIMAYDVVVAIKKNFAQA